MYYVCLKKKTKSAYTLRIPVVVSVQQNKEKAGFLGYIPSFFCEGVTYNTLKVGTWSRVRCTSPGGALWISSLWWRPEVPGSGVGPIKNPPSDAPNPSFLSTVRKMVPAFRRRPGLFWALVLRRFFPFRWPLTKQHKNGLSSLKQRQTHIPDRDITWRIAQARLWAQRVLGAKGNMNLESPPATKKDQHLGCVAWETAVGDVLGWIMF